MISFKEINKENLERVFKSLEIKEFIKEKK